MVTAFQQAQGASDARNPFQMATDADANGGAGAGANGNGNGNGDAPPAAPDLSNNWSPLSPIVGKAEGRGLFPLSDLPDFMLRLMLYGRMAAPYASLPTIGVSLLGAAQIVAQQGYMAQLPGQRAADPETVGDENAPGARIAPASLLTIAGAPSGVGKSEVYDLYMGKHREADLWLIEQHSLYQQAYERMLKQWQAARKAGNGGGAGERPDPPTTYPPIVLYGDTTLEAMLGCMSTSHSRVSYAISEMAALTGGWSFGRDQQSRTFGALCDLWSSGTASVSRIGDRSKEMRHLRVDKGAFGAHLLGQIDAAEMMLGCQASLDRGFWARACASIDDDGDESAGDMAHLLEIDKADATASFVRTRRAILEWRKALGNDTWIRGVVRTRRVIWVNDDWREYWESQYHEASYALSTDPGLSLAQRQRLLSDVRRPEIKCRIAAVLAVLACMERGDACVDRPQVTHEICRAADALGDYYCGESLRVVLRSAEDPITAGAQAFVGWAQRLLRGEMAPGKVARPHPDYAGIWIINMNQWGSKHFAAAKSNAGLRLPIAYLLAQHGVLAQLDDAPLRPTGLLLNPGVVDLQD